MSHAGSSIPGNANSPVGLIGLGKVLITRMQYQDSLPESGGDLFQCVIEQCFAVRHKGLTFVIGKAFAKTGGQDNDSYRIA